MGTQVNERTAKYLASAFAAVAALGVPIASVVDMHPLNPTALAGATLVIVYFAANPHLLVAARSQWQQVSGRGTNARIALVLGAILMVIGIIQAIASPSLNR